MNSRVYSRIHERIRRKSISAFDFHQSTKVITRSVSSSSEAPPLSWTRVQYKEYPRFRFVKLPEVNLTKLSVPLGNLIESRRSRKTSNASPFTLDELGTLLGAGCGITERQTLQDAKRSYPSAGARYPIETYLLSVDSERKGRIVYHYNIAKHGLEVLGSVLGNEDLRDGFTEDWMLECPLLIALSAVFLRSYGKYGNLAYQFALIEAGHVGQNLCLVSEACGYAITPSRAFVDDIINKILGLDGNYEACLYMFGLSHLR
jgi:SagB-type dehydrogenase family enzyme